MDEMTMSDLSAAMRKIDFAMLTTKTEGGQLAARPMSNNGEVEYDGDSYYFSWESARTIRDVESYPRVSLSFQGTGGLLGKPPLYVAFEGTAEIIRDKTSFADHWTADLDRWFQKVSTLKGWS